MTEADLCDYLKRTKFSDIKQVVNGFSPWDVTFTSSKRDFYGELKCRETHYSKMVIEQDKWRSLMLVADVTASEAAYINSTPQGVYAWNLHQMPEPDWVWDLMPETTKFGRTDKVYKRVGYLPISKAERIEE